ncbi:transmembrane protein 203-like [Sycon ciliatum]|uniref:transmembrane protein 203-like n=1 Tax=Sycon ciliatum TaxID=27933 RepID=UPI0020A9D123|eukprot:scpid75324/ scgid10776/ 
MARRQLLYAFFLEPVDWLFQLAGFIAFLVLLILVVTDTRQYSWFIVFTPMFIANGLSAYFQTMVYFGLLYDGYTREAHRRIAWITMLLVLLTLFEVLLANHLNGGDTSIGGALAPMIILFIALLLRFLSALARGRV